MRGWEKQRKIAEGETMEKERRLQRSGRKAKVEEKR